MILYFEKSLKLFIKIKIEKYSYKFNNFEKLVKKTIKKKLFLKIIILPLLIFFYTFIFTFIFTFILNKYTNISFYKFIKIYLNFV